MPCRYIIASRKSFMLKFLRIELERGLIVDVELGLEDEFVHVCLLFFFSSPITANCIPQLSHTSDHIPSLSTNSHWKLGLYINCV